MIFLSLLLPWVLLGVRIGHFSCTVGIVFEKCLGFSRLTFLKEPRQSITQHSAGPSLRNMRERGSAREQHNKDIEQLLTQNQTQDERTTSRLGLTRSARCLEPVGQSLSVCGLPSFQTFGLFFALSVPCSLSLLHTRRKRNRTGPSAEMEWHTGSACVGLVAHWWALLSRSKQILLARPKIRLKNHPPDGFTITHS